MIGEIWRSIANYEDSYQVSNLGRVRSLDRRIYRAGHGSYILKGVIRKPRINRLGYCQVQLWKEGKQKNEFGPCFSG